MKHQTTLSTALLVGASLIALVSLPACQKQEGPAEQVGKEIDKAVDKAGQQVEKAGERIQEAAKGDKNRSDQ